MHKNIFIVILELLFEQSSVVFFGNLYFLLTDIGLGDDGVLAVMDIDAEGEAHVWDGFTALVEQLLLLGLVVGGLFVLLAMLGLVASLEGLVEFLVGFL